MRRWPTRPRKFNGCFTRVPIPCKGQVYVRGALTQTAWATTRTKHMYLAAQCSRLTTRMGKSPALVAGGHSILVMACHVLSKPASYLELGVSTLIGAMPRPIA
jgi:hypothetical protein